MNLMKAGMMMNRRGVLHKCSVHVPGKWVLRCNGNEVGFPMRRSMPREYASVFPKRDARGYMSVPWKLQSQDRQ